MYVGSCQCTAGGSIGSSCERAESLPSNEPEHAHCLSRMSNIYFKCVKARYVNVAKSKLNLNMVAIKDHLHSPRVLDPTSLRIFIESVALKRPVLSNLETTYLSNSFTMLWAM